MTADARVRRAAATCAALLLATLLVACGSDDEKTTRTPGTSARGTTVGGTAVASTNTSVSTTPGVSTTAGVAATPGVGDQAVTDTGLTSRTGCRSAFGTRADPNTLAGLDAQVAGATSTTPTTTTTTTPATTTTSAGGTTAVTSEGTRAIPADQVALPRPFSIGSPWNTRIDTRPVDPQSSTWIARASRRVAIVESSNRRSVTTSERVAPDLRLYVNTCAWTPAIVGQENGETVRIVCRQRDCGNVARDVKTLKIAPGVDPFPQFDGWFSVIDQTSGVGYDMWRARRAGDVISYQFIKRWLLDGPGYSAPAVRDASAAVGARGSGLPLFAGVVQPSELRSGRIEHALAISVPGPAQRVFAQPASVTNGINAIRSLPEGSRLRLKSSFRLGKIKGGGNRHSAEAIVEALRTYGAIVVDRSITPTLYARRSTNYGSLLRGNELQGIRLSDLEVVKSAPLLRFPPLNSTEEPVQG